MCIQKAVSRVQDISYPYMEYLSCKVCDYTAVKKPSL